MSKTSGVRRRITDRRHYTKEEAAVRADKVVSILAQLLGYIGCGKGFDALRINRNRFHENFEVFTTKIGFEPRQSEESLYRVARNGLCPAVENWERSSNRTHDQIIINCRSKPDKGEILTNADDLRLPFRDPKYFEFLIKAAVDFADSVGLFE